MSAPKLTLEQAIIITAYTGVTACYFSQFHKAVEKMLGRPVYTHEFASTKFADEIKQRFTADFLEICNVEKEVK